MNISTAIALAISYLIPAPRTELLIVVGAPGTSEYAAMFHTWADRWQHAAHKGGAKVTRIGESNDSIEDRKRLKEYLTSQSRIQNPEPLWIVLIGHGTFDGTTARFNLTGPDVSAEEFAQWLAPLKRPIAFVNCASASGPFLNKASAPNRVIVTATRSGDEVNFSHFGEYISAAIGDPNADLDKDEQVSLLEAYLVAGTRVAEFYRAESRLATEHALLDDNGDQLGTPAEWFTGVRATQRPKGAGQTDGTLAHQFHLIRSEPDQAIPASVRRQRDTLERQIAALRDRKATLSTEAYYQQLEPLMLELAKLYRDQERLP